jgi:hypothetical protein
LGSCFLNIFPFPTPPDPAPPACDWTALAVERLDINRLPERLREPAAALVRDAARRRGVGFPRAAAHATGTPEPDGE